MRQQPPPSRQSEAAYQDLALSSHEMLAAMSDQNEDTKSGTYATEEVPNSSHRFKRSSFPLRPFSILSLLPLTLAPIITFAVAAEEASQSYIRGRSCYPNGLWKFATDATWEIMDADMLNLQAQRGKQEYNDDLNIPGIGYFLVPNATSTWSFAGNKIDLLPPSLNITLF
ncbi:hypothetical protein EK21DRAFT_119529 [Setomelanomma holmii]|uniref:Uncharacterized protein n=1 Tax=Setomelanomma holmii TaxID=210430 RepID=A0A9P4LDY3_9PLEO|nr:hypothetical protein EK21DRAFT_119529 [Setomelanomma holmii]